jgi:hypothetical protein
MERPSATFSTVTVVMLTTAGVTALATSANQFDDGAAGVVIAVGELGGAALETCEVVRDWAPQIRMKPRSTTPIVAGTVR